MLYMSDEYRLFCLGSFCFKTATLVHYLTTFLAETVKRYKSTCKKADKSTCKKHRRLGITSHAINNKKCWVFVANYLNNLFFVKLVLLRWLPQLCTINAQIFPRKILLYFLELVNLNYRYIFAKVQGVIVTCLK